tara:strand:- start:336 stop:671 length:336 start_codon:yes stop_codon:yes gene_type:complete
MKDKNFLDFLSLYMVLSFFILHKIMLVIIGIALAVYSLNRNDIEKLINSYWIKIPYNSYLKLITKRLKKNKTTDKDTIDYKKIELPQLVEEVEELGFIPIKEISSKESGQL